MSQRYFQRCSTNISVLLIILLLPAASAIAEIDFVTWHPIEVGRGPNAVPLGDLDNDGDLDLVVANRGDGTVSILLGNGDGTLQAAVDYDALDNLKSVAIGDLDGDGNADLVATAEGGVLVLTGTGDGTFEAGAEYPNDDNTIFTAIEDLNGDEIPDLVTVCSYMDQVAIRLGNGDGTFQAAFLFNTGSNAESAAIGLLNDDQVPDLAVVGRDSGVSILLGNGDGTFQEATQFYAGTESWTVVIADFNDDDHNDLAVANLVSDDLSVLLGQGDGTFQAAVNYPAGGEPQTVRAADLDNDGILDLVANGLKLSVLLGNGDGTFQTAENHGAGNGSAMDLGDLDGDGNLDLAVHSGTEWVSILPGLGDGTFHIAPSVEVGTAPRSVAVAHLDQDGYPDLVAANAEDDTISVILSDGKRNFAPAVEYAVGTYPNCITAAELNGDGALDLVASNLGDDNVSVLLGNGDGTFQSAVAHPAGGEAYFTASADLNGDSAADLAICNYYDHGLTILLGNGDGSFQSPVTYDSFIPVGVAPVDMDSDGDLDLAMANEASGAIRVYRNNGDGTFPDYVFTQVEWDIVAIIAEDLNGDSIDDLAAISRDPFVLDSPAVAVLLGNGTGPFEDPLYFAIGREPTSLVAGDFDGDGHPDLATANWADQSVSLLRGIGDGTFHDAVHFGAGAGPMSVAAGQLDGTGLPSLVVANSLGNDLSILYNHSGFDRLVITGPGPGYENPPLVRVFPPEQDAAHLREFSAYGPDHYGVNVAVGEMNGDNVAEILTGAGPGEIYGPHVRGFTISGQPLAGLSFFAYGTLKYGVNVIAGNLDSDGFDEIITGAGPGAVFGPHVRAFDYDGGPEVTPVAGVSYFAYGTPKWGVNVAAGDIDGDDYDEIVTGAGPGAIYGPHVRGWNVDGAAAVAMSGVNFLAYGTNRHGVKVSCGDLDGDGIDEIVTTPGPSSFFGSHVRGWNYDGTTLASMPGISFFAWPPDSVRFGANVDAGTDLDGDGRTELVVGGGPDPSMGSEVKIFSYDGSQTAEWISFEAYSGLTGGNTVAAGSF